MRGASTGLNDKHGTGIRAGDWIRYELRGNEITVRQGSVFYNAEEACWCVECPEEAGGYTRLLETSRIAVIEEYKLEEAK